MHMVLFDFVITFCSASLGPTRPSCPLKMLHISYACLMLGVFIAAYRSASARESVFLTPSRNVLFLFPLNSEETRPHALAAVFHQLSNNRDFRRSSLLTGWIVQLKGFFSSCTWFFARFGWVRVFGCPKDKKWLRRFAAGWRCESGTWCHCTLRSDCRCGCGCDDGSSGGMAKCLGICVQYLSNAAVV